MKKEKKNKKTKFGATTIKGAILQIVVSSVLLAAIIILQVLDYDKSNSTMFGQRIIYYWAAIVFGIFFLIDGIVTIICLVRKRTVDKKNETEGIAVDGTMQATAENDTIKDDKAENLTADSDDKKEE